MGVMERYNEKKKKQGESPAPSRNGVMERYELNKKYADVQTDNVNGDYINNFFTQANDFLRKEKEEESSYTSWNDLSARANTIKAWAWKNRNNLDEQTYKSLTDNLGVFDKVGQYWSQFKTPEEYSNHLKKQEEYNDYYERLEKAKSRTTEDYYKKRYQEEFDRIKSEHPNDYAFPVAAHAEGIVHEEMKAAEKEIEQIMRQLDNTAGGYKDSWFKSGTFDDGYQFGDVSGAVLGTVGDIGLSAIKGVGRMAEGLVDLGTYGVGAVGKMFGADEFWEGAKNVARYSATDEWTKGATDFVDRYSVLGDKGDAISEGLGQLAGILATGGIAGAAGLEGAALTAVTTGTMGLSSMGTNMGEAYDAGATDGEAFLYGLGTGAIDAGTELISGGLGKAVKALGISRGIGGFDDIFAKKLSSKIVKSIANESVQRVAGNTIEAIVKAGGEGFEEWLAGLGSAVMKKMTYMSHEDLQKLVEDENLLEQFVVGTIVSSVAQSPSYINANQTGTDFVTGQTLDQERAIDEISKLAIESREANGEKVTFREKNKIYNDVTDTLEKAARDVVESRNTPQTAKTEPISNVPVADDSLPTQEETSLKSPLNVRRGISLAEQLEAQSKTNEPISVEDVKKATRFGDNGAELVTEIANNVGVTFSQAERAVKTAYLAGMSNVDGAKVNFATDTQINAFTAGKKDRAMQDLLAQENAKNATVYDGAFTENEYTKNYTEAEKKMISIFVKGLKMDISAVDKIIANETIVNGEKVPHYANASHEDGKMQISSQTKQLIYKLVLHEGGHRMKQLAPKEFGILMDALYNRVEHLEKRAELGYTQDMIFDEIRAKHDNAGIEYNTSGYIEEIAVRELETIFSSAEEFNKWYNEISGNQQVKGAWEKFVAWLSELFEDIKRNLDYAKITKEERARAKETLAEVERIKGLLANTIKASEKAVQQRANEVQTKQSAETNSIENLEIKINQDYNKNASYSLKAQRGRSIEIETMENNRFERLRQFYDNLPTEWYAYTGNYFYIYSNQSYTDYTILAKVSITKTNMQDINNYTEELENGIDRGTKAFDKWLATFRRGKGRNSWHSISAYKAKTTGRNDGVDVQPSGSDNARDIKGSSKHNKSQIKFLNNDRLTANTEVGGNNHHSYSLEDSTGENVNIETIKSLILSIKAQRGIKYDGGRVIHIPNNDMATLRHKYMTEHHYSNRSGGNIDCIDCFGQGGKKHYFYIFYVGEDNRVAPIFRLDYQYIERYMDDIQKISNEMGYNKDEFITSTSGNGKGLDRVRDLAKSDSVYDVPVARKESNHPSGKVYNEEGRGRTANNRRNDTGISNGYGEQSNNGNTDEKLNKSPNYSLVDDEINQSMSMEQANDMVQRAFVLGGIEELFGGVYKNGDEWLKGEGADAVASVVEEDWVLQHKFLNKVQGVLDGDFYAADIIKAYANGTLTGNIKHDAVRRLDTSKPTKATDTRVFAPKEIENAQEVYKVASERVTNANRDRVHQARADIIMFAHNRGAAEALGLTQSELNKKLATWARYTARAKEVSMRINKDVALFNKWTGIENSNVLNRAAVSEKELDNLVNEVKGDSCGWQRSYIVRTMLALDTHIDYSELNFEFAGTVKTDIGESVNGYYDDIYRKIKVIYNAPHTVAHEIGHFIDCQWSRDLGYVGALTDGYCRGIPVDADTKQFVTNFDEFIEQIEDLADLESAYTMDRQEVFARFVAKFVQWVDLVANGKRSYAQEYSNYNDRFTTAQYVEFARLLQEKSMLDSKRFEKGKAGTRRKKPTKNLEIKTNQDYNRNKNYSLYNDEVMFSSRYNAITQSQSIRNLYDSAKKGNVESAYNLLSQLLGEDNINRIRSFGNDVHLLPVIGAEGTSANVLPKIIAEHLSAETGQSIFAGIYKENSSDSREKTVWGRMKENYPSFILGEKENIKLSDIAGKKFVLIDDNSTTGRTFVGLKNFLEENGGEVVSYYALTTGQDQSEKMITTDETWNKLLNLGLDRVAEYAEKEGVKREISKYGLTEREAQELIKQFGRKNVDSRRGYEDIARSGRGRETIQGIYDAEKEDGRAEPSKKVSFSLQDKYWHTDLNRTQIKEVEKELRQIGNPESTRITDTANWYKGRLDGEDLFVIYSTEDVSNPTILYEARGKNAKLEQNILMDLLEDVENGTSINGKSSFAQRVSEGDWVQDVNGGTHNLSSLGAGADNKDAGVLQRQSQRNGSPAFRNVIENLFKRQERGGSINESKNFSLMVEGNVSSKDTKQLLDTIEHLKNEFKVTKFAKADPKKLSKMTRELLKEYSSRADVDETFKTIDELYQYLANGEEGHPAVWEDVYNRAYDVAHDIIKNAVMVDDLQYQEYKHLRDYLRNKPMKFDSRYDSVPPYYETFNEFRKSNYGRLDFTKDGTSIDSVYQELAELYPEFFDAEEQMNSADQLERIVDVLDSIQPTEINPYSRGMEQATAYLANDIIDRFFDIPQAKPTFADKAERRVVEARIKGGKKVEAVRQQRDDKVKKLIESQREKTKKQLDKLRKQRDDKVKKEQEKRRNALSKMSEKQKTKVLRAQIMRHASDLSRKLVSPTDNQHIPHELQGVVAKLLECINLESNYTYDTENHSYKKNDEGLPTRRTQAFNELKKLYAEMASSVVVDPDLMGDNGLLSDVISLADKRIADMNSGELTAVWQTMRAIEASVSTANKMFSEGKYATILDVAEKLREANKGKKEKTELKGILGKGKTLTTLNMLTPETYFHFLGDAGDSVFRMMRDAQDKRISIMKEVANFTRKTTKGVDVNALEKTTHTVKLGGENVTLSTAQLMELYVLMKREQAIDHILVGGILPDVTKGKGMKLNTKAEPIRNLSFADITAALSNLTDEQKKIADELQKFVSTVLSEYGNEASMKVYNYEKFLEKNYWTIRTNKQEIASDIGKDTAVTTVANKGMAKGTKPHANTSVRIGSIFDTFAAHSSDMATYAAWLGTTEDVNRIRNFVFWEDGVRTGTVKGILDTVHGLQGSKYLEKLLTDISIGVKGTDNMNPLDKFIGSYKAASVGANIRVVIQQPTAIFRALDMIDARYFAESALRKPLKGWEKAKKYAPIAQWKDWGYFDINTGRQMKDVLFNNASLTEKSKQVGMWGASKADSISWGQLWNAVEAETKTKHKDLKVGSEEFYETVSKRFTEIVDHTQVVDGILQRSQIMRSPDALTKMATSYMGESTKQYNMAVAAAYDAKNLKGDVKKKAVARLGRTAVSLAVAGIINACYQSIVDALRDDDKEKDYWEKWLAALIGDGEETKWYNSNLVNAFNPLTYIPFAKDIMSIMQGYDVKRMDAEAITKTFNAVKNMYKAVTGTGKYTIAEASAQLLAEIARLYGLPVANVKRDIKSLVMSVAIETDSYLLQYRMEKAMLDVNYSGNSKNFMDILFNAYNNDREAYEYIYNDLLSSGYDADKVQSGMETRMKKAEGVEKTSELSKRYMTPTDEKKYDSSLSKIKSSQAWKSANTSQRKNAEADLYNILTSDTDDMEKLRAEARAFGVDETEYTLWQLAIEMADQPKGQKCSDSYDYKEKAEAVNLLNLGDKELAYFIGKGLTETAKEELNEALDLGIDMQEYVNFKAATSDMKADKDANGKSISGSKKSKVVNYLNNANLTDEEWDYFYYEVMNYKN